jgi:hypothetical protein
VNKVAKLASLLVAVLLLSVFGVVQLASAQATDATVDRDYVSNAPPADNSFVVTITDTGRDTSGAADEIGSANLEVKNLATGVSINVTSTETAVTSDIFTVTINVTSSASSAATASIQAADGDTIAVTYTPASGGSFTAATPAGVFVVTVDGVGPVIDAHSPSDDLKTKYGSQLFEAEVIDAGIGVGAGADEVKVNTEVWIAGAEFVPIVADLTGGSWRISRGNTFSTDRDVTWYIVARDDLGNESRSDSDADTAGDQDFTVTIDLTPPAIDSAITGDVADDSADPVVNDATADDRTSIRVVFDENLSGASINTDGSDFLILVGETQLVISGAAWYEDLPNTVYITVSADLAADDTPVVRVVREIQDEAENPWTTGEVTAADGIAPALTVTLTGTASSRPVTNDTFVVRVSVDEDSTNPTLSTGVVVFLDDDADEDLDGTQVVAAFATITDNKTWEWTFTFNSDGTQDGLYNVCVEISDGSNEATAGEGIAAGDCGGAGTAIEHDDALLFEVDNGISFDPAADVVPLSTDDTSSFINVGFVGEATEYDGDSHGTIVSLTATVGGDAVEVSTIDDITFTIAAPLGGYALGDVELVLTATDETGNAVTYEAITITIEERAFLSIPLRPGFNIISLPGNPVSSALNDVIPADHPINQVLTFVAGTGWLIAERGDDGNFAGTLGTIDSSRAYIVRTTSFEPLDVLIPRVGVGERVLPPTVELNDGWNLVPVIDFSGDLAAGDEIVGYFADIGIRTLSLSNLGRLEVNPGGDDAKVGTGYWVFSVGEDVLVP